MLKSPIQVSVILPVYNGAEDVAECLESLLDQSYNCKEIIVINDGSTDNTAEIVKIYPVKLVTITHSGRSCARNVGLREAKGDIIAFVEHDAVYSSHYLESLVKHFENPSVGGAIGPHFVLNAKNFITKCKDIERRVHFMNYKPFTGWVYRRNVLLEVGGFDENLEYAEDADVGLRVRMAGYKIVFEPKAVWFHREPDSLHAFLERKFRGGMGIVSYAAKHQQPLFPNYLLILPIGIISLLLLLSLMTDLWFIWTSASLVFLIAGRIRWLKKAIRSTNKPVHCLGWVFLEYLGWAAILLGIIHGKLSKQKIAQKLRGR